MLLRQMTAHAMDQWAREQDRGNVIPHQMRLLSLAENRDGFPQSFYKLYDAKREVITQRFFDTFGETLSESNRTRLETEAREGKLTARIRAAFQAVADERKRLTARIKELEERKKALEADPTLAIPDEERPDQSIDQAAEEELASLEDAIRGYGRLLGNLLDKHPLNVLTDEGVLPNYAFPEPGVTLKSVLRTPRQRKKRKQPADTKEQPKGAYEKLRFEYIRPASAALKEFAPFNTFYAEGHKMNVTQIDVGTPTQPLIEAWRFCPRCHHSARIIGEETELGPCPVCGEPGWSDQGTATGGSPLPPGVVLDGSGRRSYRRRHRGAGSPRLSNRELIDCSNVDGSGAERLGARLIEEGDVLFGYELLRDLELRQLNFGQTGDTSLPVRIGGEEVVQPGFLVCRSCGRVQDPFSKSTSLQHVPYCKTRLGKAPEKTAHVFLYRTLRSEAIRLLLPVSKHGLMRMRASVSAALQLGFRKMFGGQPTHLRITTASEPHGDDQLQFPRPLRHRSRRTGYLAELWKAGKLLDLMELSLQAMRTCPCAADPNRDGCYRCIFAYQDAWQLPNISRREAVHLFERILGHRHAEKEQVTLSQVSVVSVLESELEARFVEALKTRALERKWSWKPGRLRGQGRLAPSHPKQLRQRALAGRAPGSHRPRGWRRQALPPRLRPAPRIPRRCPAHRRLLRRARVPRPPDQPKARIADDIDKRQSFSIQAATASGPSPGAISTSSWVWTRTLPDSPLRAQPRDSEAGRGGCRLRRPRPARARQHGVARPLPEQPDAAAWTKRSLVITLGLLRVTDGMGDQALLDAWHKLGTEPVDFPLDPQPKPPGQWLGGWVKDQPFSHLMLRIRTQRLASKDIAAQQFMLRLFDEHPARQQPEFEASWRAFLHAWNFLQFHHDQVAVVSSERIEQGDVSHPATLPSERPPPMPPAPVGGEEAAELIGEVEDSEPLILAVVAQNLPLPSIDLIVENDIGGVGLEAILAWSDQHIVVCYDLSERDRKRWQEFGFQAFDFCTAPELIAEALSAAVGRRN